MWERNLLPEALPLRGAADDAGDVDELHGRGQHLGQAEDLGELAAARSSGTPTTPTLGSIVAKG